MEVCSLLAKIPSIILQKTKIFH